MSKCPDHSLIIQAVVVDAVSLYEELKANGFAVSEPEDKPWGQREFAVLTPDGHRIMFSQRFESDPQDDS